MLLFSDIIYGTFGDRFSWQGWQLRDIYLGSLDVDWQSTTIGIWINVTVLFFSIPSVAMLHTGRPGEVGASPGRYVLVW